VGNKGLMELLLLDIKLLDVCIEGIGGDFELLWVRNRMRDGLTEIPNIQLPGSVLNKAVRDFGNVVCLLNGVILGNLS
jgi:hypothetical protein